MWLSLLIFLSLILPSFALFFGCPSLFCPLPVCCCTCQMPAYPPSCNCPASTSAVQSNNYAVPSDAHLLPRLGTYLPSPNYQIQEAQYYSLPSSPSRIGDQLTGNAPYGDSLNNAEVFRSGYGLYDANAAFTSLKSSQWPALTRNSERQGWPRAPFLNPPILVEGDKNACHIISDGYACCSMDLEATMIAAYKQLSRQPGFNDCNIGLIAKILQRAVERKFDKSFETIVALKDFAAQTAYKGNLTCKFERDGKYFYSYATPIQYDIKQRVIQEGFSSANLTQHTGRTPSEKRANLEEKQRPIHSVNRSAPTRERTVRSINDLSNVNYINFNNVNSTTTGGVVIYELTMADPSMHVGTPRRRLHLTC